MADKSAYVGVPKTLEGGVELQEVGQAVGCPIEEPDVVELSAVALEQSVHQELHRIK